MEDQKISNGNLKFLCSYGGKILLRNSDVKLRYVGGLTRVLSVDRSISFAELMVKLGEFCGFSVNLKCPLPDGDLETLISITSDEDLANLIEEYDRASASSSLPLKIRAILTQSKYLKSISPPSSASPSVVNFSTSTSNSNSPPFGTLNSVPNRTVVRRGGSPIMGYPISHQREYGNFCYHPCQVQRNPNKISCQYCDHHNYHHHQCHQQVPQYSNYRQ